MQTFDYRFVRRKDFDINQLNGRIEDEQNTVSQLSRKVKEFQGRIDDTESKLEVERNARNKLERNRNELVREMDHLSEQLEEAGGATAAQVSKVYYSAALFLFILI